MARSTGRTLLSKMGFQDLDAGNTDHDLACQFLALVENALALHRVVYPLASAEWERHPVQALAEDQHKKQDDNHWADEVAVRHQANAVNSAAALKVLRGKAVTRPPKHAASSAIVRADGYERRRVGLERRVENIGLEVPIQKGEGSYSTTVGFADLIMRVVAETAWETRTPGGTVLVDRHRTVDSRDFLVEVKSTRVSGSEVLKQMNLYMQYLRVDVPVIATLFDFTVDDARMLRSQGMFLVRLGKKFQEWKATRGGLATDVEEI